MNPVDGARAARRRRARWGGLLGALIALGVMAAFTLRDEGGLALFRRDATWVRILDQEKLRVGLDPSFPPFEALDAAGAPVGYDVDLAQALAERWGLRLELVAMGYDSLVDALMASQVDVVISAMPYDERLTRDLSISPAYFEAGLRLAAPAGSPIQGTDALAGATVAVEWGSAGDMVARRLLREANDAGAEPAFAIAQFETADQAMQAAAGGAADAVLVDAVSLRLAQGAGSPLVAVGPVLEANPYVILSPRRGATLAAEIAAALAALRSDGTLAALEDRWFGPAAQPTLTPQSTP